MPDEKRHARKVTIPLPGMVTAICFLLLVWSLAGWGFRQLVRTASAAYLLNSSNDVSALESSVRLNPLQPEAHSRLGFLYLYDPITFDPLRARDQLRTTVQMAPHRYEEWLDLGRAYEQNGELEKADASLRVGVQLAPSYSRTHWRYANFLLRNSRLHEAIDEFTHAATISPALIDSTCEIIWQGSNQQDAALREFAERLGSQESRLAVVQSLAYKRNLPELAARVWEKVELDPHSGVTDWSDRFSRWLLETGHWDLAEGVALRTKEASLGPLAAADRRLFNGECEYPLGIGALDWMVANESDVRVSIDARSAHAGERSLCLQFLNHDRVTFDPGVTHWLIVKPSSEYVLRYYYRTAEMLRDTGLHVTILGVPRLEGGTPDARGLSKAAEWTAEELRFWTSPGAHTVQISINRKPADILYDFVDGRAWFDSFSLTEVRATGE